MHDIIQFDNQHYKKVNVFWRHFWRLSDGKDSFAFAFLELSQNGQLLCSPTSVNVKDSVKYFEVKGKVDHTEHQMP